MTHSIQNITSLTSKLSEQIIQRDRLLDTISPIFTRIQALGIFREAPTISAAQVNAALPVSRQIEDIRRIFIRELLPLSINVSRRSEETRAKYITGLQEAIRNARAAGNSDIERALSLALTCARALQTKDEAASHDRIKMIALGLAAEGHGLEAVQVSYCSPRSNEILPSIGAILLEHGHSTQIVKELDANPWLKDQMKRHTTLADDLFVEARSLIDHSGWRAATSLLPHIDRRGYSAAIVTPLLREGSLEDAIELANLVERDAERLVLFDEIIHAAAEESLDLSEDLAKRISRVNERDKLFFTIAHLFLKKGKIKRALAISKLIKNPEQVRAIRTEVALAIGLKSIEENKPKDALNTLKFVHEDARDRVLSQFCQSYLRIEGCKKKRAEKFAALIQDEGLKRFCLFLISQKFPGDIPN